MEKPSKETLENWLASYPYHEKKKTIAVIMAGNIPLVGFHDFMCVLFSGYSIQIKLSSEDNRLFYFIYEILVKIDARFADKIQIADGKLASFIAEIEGITLDEAKAIISDDVSNILKEIRILIKLKSTVKYRI